MNINEAIAQTIACFALEGIHFDLAEIDELRHSIGVNHEPKAS